MGPWLDATNFVMSVSPFAELGAAKATTAVTEVPLIMRNAARGSASEARVLNDIGLPKNTGRSRWSGRKVDSRFPDNYNDSAK